MDSGVACACFTKAMAGDVASVVFCRGDVSERAGLGRAAHVDASVPPMHQEIEGSGLSRGSLLAPNSPKKVSRHATALCQDIQRSAFL